MTRGQPWSSSRNQPNPLKKHPAFWLFALHAQEHRHLCAHMPSDFSTEVSRFLASGQKSEVVLFTLGPQARQSCQRYGLPLDPIPLRLIRVPLKSGEIEVLATSLRDEEAYPSA